MLMRTRQLALAATMLGLAFGVTGPAEAGIVLATPSGLAPGDQFRFVFITDGTTTATSSSIATYNNFVNTQAGGATYAGSVVTWEAIGSTVSEAQSITSARRRLPFIWRTAPSSRPARPARGSGRARS